MQVRRLSLIGPVTLMLVGAPGGMAVTQAAAGPDFMVVAVDDMAKGRSDHEATLLPDGRVLVTGGGWADGELLDPATSSFEATGKMARIRPITATLLDDGRVLVAGGRDRIAESFYDPTSGAFQPHRRDARRTDAAHGHPAA